MMIRKALGALACAAVLAPSIVLADSAGGDETTSQMQRDPLDQPGLRSQALPLGGSRDQVDSGTAFNPALSVILDGVYYSEISGEWDSPAGFDSGHSHSHGHGHDTIWTRASTCARRSSPSPHRWTTTSMPWSSSPWKAIPVSR